MWPHAGGYKTLILKLQPCKRGSGDPAIPEIHVMLFSSLLKKELIDPRNLASLPNGSFDMPWLVSNAVPRKVSTIGWALCLPQCQRNSQLFCQVYEMTEGSGVLPCPAPPIL